MIVRALATVALTAGLLVLFHAAAGAQTTERKLALEGTSSIEKIVARKLLEREAGQPVAADTILIEAHDLNADGFTEIFVSTEDPKLCPSKPCRVRLYSLIGDNYVDLLAGTEAFSIVPPDTVILNARRRNGFPELHFGPIVAVLEGRRYVDVAQIRPTSLDATAFNAACARSGELRTHFEEQGAEAEAGQNAACGCIAQGFDRWGMTQSDLDSYAMQIGGGLNDQEETAVSKDEAERILIAGTEIHDACLREQGLGFAPEFPELATPDRSIDGLPFFETCAAQNWIRAHDKIGSEDRAFAYCACLAGSFADAGLEQADVDGLTKLFNGEISDGALNESRPDAIDISDTESERCLGAMPLR